VTAAYSRPQPDPGPGEPAAASDAAGQAAAADGGPPADRSPLAAEPPAAAGPSSTDQPGAHGPLDAGGPPVAQTPPDAGGPPDPAGRSHIARSATEAGPLPAAEPGGPASRAISPPPAPGPGGPATQAGPLPPAPQPGGPGAEAGPPAPADAVVAEPRRRLHPLSPLLSGAKSIAVIVAALSWQTLSQVGIERFALVVAVVAVGVVVFAVIGWLNTGYHVVGRELRIQDGLLWRRNRAIPLDRLQAVEMRRPLLAQLTGLAELRLEVVGGGKTEAPLAYLSVREAAALRQRLLALAGRTPGVVAPGAAEPAAAAPERPLFRVSNRDLLISQLLTPQAFLLPIGVAFVVMQFVLEGSWTFVGIASTVTAMAGVLLQPVRRVLQDWDFRLARDPDGRLAVRYGLLETRSQIVPLNRVQSIGVTWPLLWRAKDWLHMRLDIAGYAGPQSHDDKRSDRLLPVGVFAAGRQLVWEVLPGVDLAALATLPPPDRARWLHPFALRSFGTGLTPEVFVARSGLFTKELTMVPYARLQSVRVVQGPVQRMLRLATVYADTAGGRSGVAQDRDVAEAWWIAEQLSIRARHARAATAQVTGRQQPILAPAVPGPAFAGQPTAGLDEQAFRTPGLPDATEHGPAAEDSSGPGQAPLVDGPSPSPAAADGPVPGDDAYWRRPPQP
jgi:putative membrane protein